MCLRKGKGYFVKRRLTEGPEIDCILPWNQSYSNKKQLEGWNCKILSLFLLYLYLLSKLFIAKREILLYWCTRINVFNSLKTTLVLVHSLFYFKPQFIFILYFLIAFISIGTEFIALTDITSDIPSAATSTV